MKRKKEVKVENLEFSDFSATISFVSPGKSKRDLLCPLIYSFIYILLVLVWRHTHHEFRIEHGTKLTSDTDMGISFFRIGQYALKYDDVHAKLLFF